MGVDNQSYNQKEECKICLKYTLCIVCFTYNISHNYLNVMLNAVY